MSGFYIFFLHLKKLLETAWLVMANRKVQNWPLLLADFYGLVKGEYILKLAVNKGKLVLRAGTYDRWSVTEIILKDIYGLFSIKGRSSLTVIDLGAHIGTLSVLAKLIAPKAKVYAYEPEPSNFALLKKNIALNHFQAGIHLFPLACASKAGVKRLYGDKLAQSGTLLPQGRHYRLTPTITLGKILEKNKIKVCHFLKIDVEGAEYEILYSSAEKTFRKIQRISLEYHNVNEKTNLNGRSLKAFLEKQGYWVSQKKTFLGKTGYLQAVRT